MAGLKRLVITGPPGSGKTLTGQNLTAAFPGKVFHVDEALIPRRLTGRESSTRYTSTIDESALVFLEDSMLLTPKTSLVVTFDMWPIEETNSVIPRALVRGFKIIVSLPPTDVLEETYGSRGKSHDAQNLLHLEESYHKWERLCAVWSDHPSVEIVRDRTTLLEVGTRYV